MNDLEAYDLPGVRLEVLRVRLTEFSWYDEDVDNDVFIAFVALNGWRRPRDPRRQESPGGRWLPMARLESTGLVLFVALDVSSLM